MRALYRCAAFKPIFTLGVVILSFCAAFLEGIGLSFILPIIELASQGEVDPDEASRFVAVFLYVFQTLDIPFSLGYLVLGVSVVMTVRYLSDFVVRWLRLLIQYNYVVHLQETAYDQALGARVSYFDKEGSDDVLNAIVTQAELGAGSIKHTITTLNLALLCLTYFAVALYLAPVLTALTMLAFGVVLGVTRVIPEGGYALGDKVAKANERIQQVAQAGVQGIRDVKVFGLSPELREEFMAALNRFRRSKISLRRNEIAMDRFYNLATAITVFVLIYVAITRLALSLGGLGVFLFAMFRLGPMLSTLNSRIYKLEGVLPHLVRTQEFIDELEGKAELDSGNRSVPTPVETVAFDNVSFSYEDDGEQVLENVSLSIDRKEFVAFVGPSGAGKSTIASLLARLYVPDSGRILADGIPIEEYDLQEWRSRVSLVRQDPYIFDDTLRENVTIGDRDAPQMEIERVCEIAGVTEFLDDLPNGYDTEIGDNGVRLSGGQRQRVAIARALLKDADILILDEATSDMDTRLEQRVHSAIEQMDREYAIVTIAHRLSTVKDADRIYTVENGKITEQGDHEELLHRDGKYAELYAVQS